MGGDFHGFEAEVELSDDGVAEPFPAAAVELDVVGCPSLSKWLGSGGELADEFDECFVVGAAADAEWMACELITRTDSFPRGKSERLADGV